MKHIVFFLILFGGLAVGSVAFAQNATLYFVPAIGTYAPGQTFRATVMVDTNGQNVNAVAAYFTYPADKFDVLGIDKTGSAMTLFAEEAAAGGRVDISGGKPTPGFSGIQKIASVDFRVKTGVSGSAALVFTSSAAVLRDSDNQNILSLPNSGTATIQIGQGTTPLPLRPPPPPATPEPTPPSSPSASDSLQITDVQAQHAGPNSIQISWKTNKTSSARVDYGVGGVYDFSVLGEETGQDHSVLLMHVQEGGEYQFQVKSATAEGEVALVEGLTLEDLVQETDEEIVARETPEEPISGGFQFTRTSLVLFVGLPLMVLLVVVVLVVVRIRGGNR